MSYRMWWLVRAHVICMMRLHGVRRLSLGKNMTFDRVSQANFVAPDQGGWVQHWLSQCGGNVGKVCRELAFVDPPALLSEFVWIAGESAIAKYREEEILAHAKQIHQEHEACKHKWGWEGNSAVIIQHVFQQT